MQVNKPFEIELIFRGTNKTVKINTFSRIEHLVHVGHIGQFFSTMECEYGKPIGFKLIKLNMPVTSKKFINWLKYEFKLRFDYDPLLWLASVATLPVELHQYLIPFYAEQVNGTNNINL